MHKGRSAKGKRGEWDHFQQLPSKTYEYRITAGYARPNRSAALLACGLHGLNPHTSPHRVSGCLSAEWLEPEWHHCLTSVASWHHNTRSPSALFHA